MATKKIDIDDIDMHLLEVVKDKEEDFLKNFLAVYSFASSTYKKLITKGKDTNGYYSIKQKLLYKEVDNNADIEAEYFKAIENAKAKERFIIINNFTRFMAKDMRSGKGIDIDFEELPDNYEFFLPWMGREITDSLIENPADVKAAAKMGHLFESIIKDNNDMDRKDLNIFLTRILFCYFAEDTGIFPQKKQFIDSLINNTKDDGSDLGEFLRRLFVVLDLKQENRKNINVCYKNFPYVNGGLFREKNEVPHFTKSSRKKLIEGGTLDWAEINPDIFGSMFQTVIDPEQRRHLGQHYTSVTNIMKVLNPLFLDDLHDELDKIGELPPSKNRDSKLTDFRNKLSRIKIFDPAVGAGNFLIISYKEICKLEMEAISMYHIPILPFLSIHLDHFYGIEIDDFPCEIARLSLWLAQHQINMECYTQFGNSNPTLPLTTTGNIVCGNALELDWESVCPVDSSDIIYIASNPPYVGRNLLEENQKNEVNNIMSDCADCGHLDYVWCWLKLASKYIEKGKSEKCRAAMVTTNSVSQGIQVSAWKTIFKHNCDIAFVHKSFPWENNASKKAAVIVSIVGIKKIDDICEKYIFNGAIKQNVNHINPYFTDSKLDLIVTKSNILPFGLKMAFGSMFRDGGNLLFTDSEKDDFISKVPLAKPLLKKLIGADEFIKGKERWCLWIDDNNKKIAFSIPEVYERIKKVKTFRLASKAKETQEFANTPWAAAQICYKKGASSLFIPAVSSETRYYIPIGFLPPETITVAPNFTIYDAPEWLFAILTSAMHMSWMRAVAGRLKSDYRYSNTLCYNTFPFPILSDLQKNRLKDSAMAIIRAREIYYDKTNAELYNNKSMPKELLSAHEANDLLVDSFYKKLGFKNDEERLSELFKRYEQNIKERN